MKSFRFLTLAFVLGCQPQSPNPVERWVAEDAAEPPQVLVAAQKELEKESARVTFGDSSVFIKEQARGGLKFANSQIHGVQDKEGQWQVLSGSEIPRLSALQTLRARRMLQSLKSQEKIFKKLNPGWDLDHSEVIHRNGKDEAGQLFYQFIAFAPDQTDVMSFLYDSSMELRSQESVAHQSVVGRAQVFTARPDISELTDQLLPDLLGTGRLQSPRLKLSSAKNPSAFSEEHSFEFSPEDMRFDEVQAYFFTEKALNYFRDKFKLELRQPLDVQVHVGAPQKTNAAFYYNSRVRLGSGDNITYKHIPRDPTIVSHEVAHAFVDLLSGLPFQGEGGSLNEAFSDFFAADMNNQPEMAAYSYLKGPYRRTLENGYTGDDLEDHLYGDSLVFSGTLWELRSLIGPEKARDLAVKILIDLGPRARYTDFAQILIRRAQQNLSEPDTQQVVDLLERRRLTDL